ncbi:MAG: 16S rRNA (cytidine(1402)-2'-O)-methyltransferase [Oscillospiraceae bacterium]
METKIFLVATPIGNLGDFSKRAVETLKNVDFILCEDTRVTVKLLNHFDIKKPLLSYNMHTEFEKLDNVIDRVLNGETCAIVSDAGMPCIADPGKELVKKCHSENIKMTVIPGANAAIAAVAISGLDTDKFTFLGFLDKNKKKRYEEIEEVKNLKHSLIFYETPHRIIDTIEEFFNILGDRKISIIREISKIYEEINLTTIKEAMYLYKEKQPRGEFVLVVEGQTKNNETSLEEAVKKADSLTKKGYSVKDASKIISIETGVKKVDIYKQLILKNN